VVILTLGQTVELNLQEHLLMNSMNYRSSEREKLKQSLDDLYRDTPQTEVAALRFKKLMTKVGKESYSAMKEIIIGILSEAARKSLFGG
jgi:hypothetical protein